MKLKPLSLGLSLGIIWGGALFLTTWLCLLFGYGKVFLEVLAGSIYPGYGITAWGSIVGLLYGFLDLFIMGTLSAWLYNKFAGAGETRNT